MTQSRKSRRGFTFIEILIVVVLIAILAAVTIVAINPSKSFADTRNATRSSDINTLLNAIKQYTSMQGNNISDLGDVPSCDKTPATIGTDDKNINLAKKLVPEFIVTIPKDPSYGTDGNTGYTICITSTSRIQVGAAHAENGKIIIIQQ